MKLIELKKKERSPKYVTSTFSIREDKLEMLKQIAKSKGLSFSEMMQSLADALINQEVV